MKKDIIRVFTTNLIKMLSTIIVTFIIPNFLPIDGYANIKLFQLYVSYIGALHLGFCDGIFLTYGGKKFNECDMTRVALERNSLLVYQIVVTFVMLIFARNYVQFFCILSFLPSASFTYYTYMYQATGEFKKYADIMTKNSILSLIANFILIFVTKDYRDYIFTYTCVFYVIFFYSFFSLKVNKAGISLKILFENMKLGFLLMVGNLAYTFFLSIDKWFVKFTLGMESFAYYSFATQLLTVINMFMTPVALTLYNHFCKNKSKEFEIKVKGIIIRVLCGMIFITFIFVWIIEKFMVNYTKSIYVLAILMIAQVFLSFNIVVYVNLFKVYKKKREYIKNLIIVIIISISLNYIVYIFNSSMKMYAMATLASMLLWTKINEKHFKYLAFNKKETLIVIISIGLYSVLFCII